MLLGNSIKNSRWKLINYRQIRDFIGAEFLHDLYNQAQVDINPVHFRNTVCILEGGEFKSYAPEAEWTDLANVLGENLVRNSALREAFSNYLERPQGDLVDLIEETHKKYGSATVIPHVEKFYDLSRLQNLALDRIYAINLVQFEHALGHVITNVFKTDRDQINSLLKSSELTISGREEVAALTLSLKVSRQELDIDTAAERYDSEFGGIKSAYGANSEHALSARQRITALTALDEASREARILTVTSVAHTKDIQGASPVVKELGALSVKLGERRDRNKGLMGKVSAVREKILDKISTDTGVPRVDLSLYFMKDIFSLLVHNVELSTEQLGERKSRIVLKRSEVPAFGIEAVALSEDVLPQSDPASPIEISGIVASKGTIRGIVKKVYSAKDAQAVASNHIMVAYGTDFDLMAGLQNCSGVITEEGGLLSHASVISRELSKPCLIAVRNAMSIYNDGDVIEIDTSQAVVKLIAAVQPDKNNGDIRFLNEVSSDEISGNKARTLKLLSDAGFAVLPGLEIDGLVAQDKAANIIDKFATAGYRGGSLIVRSNTDLEDSALSSMAGNYDSVVCGPQVHSLKKAISQVVDSYSAPKIIGSAPAKTTSVLIQPYFKQDFGGVVFSQNPVTGANEPYIEASSLGAAFVVEGRGNKAVLPLHIKDAVTATVIAAEKRLGYPVDMEWGYGDGRLVIFQARAITRLEAPDNAKMNDHLGKLLIIAGGDGTRIRPNFDGQTAPFTKHFLPLPEPGGSIIGALVEKAERVFSDVEISTSSSTEKFARALFANRSKVSIVRDNDMVGPLAPIFSELAKTNSRVFACCGDVHAHIDWQRMLDFHKQSGCPVTIFIAPSFPAAKAACFNLGLNGRIIGWERKDKSGDNDLINIGGYIIEPHTDVKDIANGLFAAKNCKEDPFFESCIQRGIIAGYTDGSFACNINTPEVYTQLVERLSGNGPQP